MATILQLRERALPLRDKETVYGLFFQVVKQFEKYLVDFNQIRLEDGEDVFGEITGRYKLSTELESLFGSPKPIRRKREGQPYNFQWTGGLFDGMKIELFDDRAEFTSTDSKAPELVAKYGDIFGLQKKDLEEALRQKLYPNFMKLIRSQLGL